MDSSTLCINIIYKNQVSLKFTQSCSHYYLHQTTGIAIGKPEHPENEPKQHGLTAHIIGRV